MSNLRVTEEKRMVHMYTDWWTGVGFIIPEIVFPNELFVEQGS